MTRKNPYKDSFKIDFNNEYKNEIELSNNELNKKEKSNLINPNSILQSLSKNIKPEYKTYSFYLERNILLQYEKFAKEKNMSISEVINFVLKENLK